MGIGNPCNHVATSQVGEFKYVAKHLPLELVSVPAIHSGLSPEHDPVARGEFLGDPAHRHSKVIWRFSGFLKGIGIKQRSGQKENV